MLEAFKKIPTIWKVLIGLVVVAVLYFTFSGLMYTLSSGFANWNDNRKDANVEKKNAELQVKIDENNKKISVLEADNIKLKQEREDQDKVNKLIKEAIANDGKIFASEQKKIDEAQKKYEDTKNSCAAATDPDTYTQCVCAKLGVTCD